MNLFQIKRKRNYHGGFYEHNGQKNIKKQAFPCPPTGIREWRGIYKPTERLGIIGCDDSRIRLCNNPLDILFDDEAKNRNNWTGKAYDVQNILEILKTF